MADVNIEKSPLWADIRDILRDGSKPVRFDYKGMIHTEKEDIPVLKIITIDILRDYLNQVGDHIQVGLKLGLGDYMVRVYPYRTNLEMTIKRYDLDDNSTEKRKNTNIVTERYKVIFLPDDNFVPSGTEMELYDTETLNRSDIVNVKLQLLDRALEPLRVTTTSGVYRDVTQEQLITSVMVAESENVLVDGKVCIDGIDIVPPDNTAVMNHVVIPTGTHLSALPSYLQDKQGGIYTGGVGTYLQKFNNNKLWFIYPLFNLTRFDDAIDRAIVYAVPQNRFPELDRTYKKDGSLLSILATSTKQYSDSADTEYMNTGSGFRAANANTFMKKPVQITEDGPKGARANVNHEVVLKERKDGLNYAPQSSEGPTSNVYKQYAKLLCKESGKLTFVWENAQYDLLLPGMCMKYIFLDKNKPVEIKGVLLHTHIFISLQGTGITGNTYKNKCSLTLTCENKPVTRDVPISTAPGEF